MLIEKISQLVGIIPKQFDPVMYVICVVVLVWLLDIFFHIFRKLVDKWI